MKKSRLLLAFSAAALIAISFPMLPASSYSNPPEKKDAQKEAAPKPAAIKAAFDASHAEIFKPTGDGALNYSAFYESFKASGGSVAENNEKITKKALEGLNVYVLAGPAKELAADEVEALKTFVNDGGSVLVLLHISQPVARLTETFGIVVSNFVIAENANKIKGAAQDFYVKKFLPHPVTEGVKKVAVYGTWGLMAEGGIDVGAKVVAETSPRAWADINRNRRHDKGEALGTFGIIGISRYGKGKVVVVADDAPFANKFIKEADNRLLAGNILKWFSEKTR